MAPERAAGEAGEAPERVLGAGQRPPPVTTHAGTPFVERRRPRHQSPPNNTTATPSAAALAGSGAPREQPDTRPRLVLSHRRVAGRTATGAAGGGATGAAASTGVAGADTAADGGSGRSSEVTAQSSSGDTPEPPAAGRTRVAGAATGATVGSPGG